MRGREPKTSGPGIAGKRYRAAPRRTALRVLPKSTPRRMRDMQAMADAFDLFRLLRGATPAELSILLHKRSAIPSAESCRKKGQAQRPAACARTCDRKGPSVEPFRA